MRLRCSGLAAAVLVCLAAPSGHVATSQAKPRPASGVSDRPVFFLHGIQHDAGANCQDTFGPLMGYLRSAGFDGPFETVNYYVNDENCTNGLDHHPTSLSARQRHRRHHASGHDNGNHTLQTNLRHLGYHFAWDVNDHYPNRAVDIVAHSMGGLIARYAIAQSERGAEGFPPRIRVRNVVTLATPHGGSAYAGLCSGFVMQCRQMAYDSEFLRWLRQRAPHPDGEGGTDWSTVGSEDDNYVTPGSAGDMRADHNVIYAASNNVEHGDYMTHRGPQNANVRWRDRPHSWRRWRNAPRSMLWTRLAVAAGSW
jgi:pimeloyl-ACP methyl ester carboxylesterase